MKYAGFKREACDRDNTLHCILCLKRLVSKEGPVCDDELFLIFEKIGFKRGACVGEDRLCLALQSSQLVMFRQFEAINNGIKIVTKPTINKSPKLLCIQRYVRYQYSHNCA